MSKKILIPLFLLVALVAYCGYIVSAHDNRSASNLSAFCDIDFRGVMDRQTNTVTGATLSIIDFRYQPGPLEHFFLITVDGRPYKIDSIALSSQPPTYSPGDYATASYLKHTNMLFVTFPLHVLQEIPRATTVTVTFKYANRNTGITLPLSAADLQYWKNQLPAF